jgi:hypothetical protein
MIEIVSTSIIDLSTSRAEPMCGLERRSASRYLLERSGRGLLLAAWERPRANVAASVRCEELRDAVQVLGSARCGPDLKDEVGVLSGHRPRHECAALALGHDERFEFARAVGVQAPADLQPVPVASRTRHRQAGEGLPAPQSRCPVVSAQSAGGRQLDQRCGFVTVHENSIAGADIDTLLPEISTVCA